MQLHCGETLWPFNLLPIPSAVCIPVCDFSARDSDLRPFVLHADLLVFAGGGVDVLLVESCYDGVMPEAGGAPPAAAGPGVEAVLAAGRG